MTLIWVKLVHIAAVSVWAGGLMALPLLLAAQPAPAGHDRNTPAPAALRHFYIGWLSPAAFVALISGGALVGLGSIHTDWFAAKLLLVTLFALVHILVARRLAEGDGHRRLLLRAIAATAGAIALGVLWLVLAKPGLGLALPCDGPGELRLLVLSLQGDVSSSCSSMASP